MSKPKMSVLADIASIKVTFAGFQQIVATLEEKFDVVACKFYNYVPKKYKDFKEYIDANGYGKSAPSVSRRRGKLDSVQVMDAYEISQLANVDAVAIMAGEGDIIPVVDLLKSCGLDVYEIDVEEGKYSNLFTGFVKVSSDMLRA
jgi:uncharacterized LabA/DUF88 family protein